MSESILIGVSFEGQKKEEEEEQPFPILRVQFLKCLQTF